MINREFVEYCALEVDDGVTLDEVLEATSTMNDSMARAVIEEERAERFSWPGDPTTALGSARLTIDSAPKMSETVGT